MVRNPYSILEYEFGSENALRMMAAVVLICDL